MKKLLEVNTLVNRTIKKLLDKEYIDKKTSQYLKVEKSKPGKFYLLPKIRKKLHNVPGSPVISNYGLATEKISEFLDFYIKLLVGEIPSLARDTTHFLSKLGNMGQVLEDS